MKNWLLTATFSLFLFGVYRWFSPTPPLVSQLIPVSVMGEYQASSSIIGRYIQLPLLENEAIQPIPLYIPDDLLAASFRLDFENSRSIDGGEEKGG